MPKVTGNYWYKEILKPKFPDFSAQCFLKNDKQSRKKGYLRKYLVLCLVYVPEFDSKILKVNFHLPTAGLHTVAD